MKNKQCVRLIVSVAHCGVLTLHHKLKDPLVHTAHTASIPVLLFVSAFTLFSSNITMVYLKAFAICSVFHQE